VTSSSKGFFESEQQFNYLNDLYLLIYRLTKESIVSSSIFSGPPCIKLLNFVSLKPFGTKRIPNHQIITPLLTASSYP